MALEGVRDEEETFKTWDDVKYFARGKDLSVRMWRCTPRMRVSEDKFIQTEDRERVYVSDRGWSKLCSLLGCDFRTIQRINSPGLATKVLNDAWNRDRESMLSRRVVVDGWTVVGIVGSRYQQFGHGRLVELLETTMREKRTAAWSKAERGWNSIMDKGPIARSVGTELRINLPLQECEHRTKIAGDGGDVADVSWLGIEARNGLGGECSVSVRKTVFRMICANGLVRPAADTRHRVAHTGDEAGLDRRVRRILGTAGDDISEDQEWLEALGNKVFDTGVLAADREGIRLLRQVLDDVPGGSTWSRRLTGSKDLGRVARTLGALPVEMAGHLSGAVWHSPYRDMATWWDFVNVFTEAARQCGSLQKQLRIEERAGRLADRLLKLEPRRASHAP